MRTTCFVICNSISIITWEIAAFYYLGNCHLGKCLLGKWCLGSCSLGKSYLGKSRFGKMSFGKYPLWEFVAWEIVLGKEPLGKILAPYSIHGPWTLINNSMQIIYSFCRGIV